MRLLKKIFKLLFWIWLVFVSLLVISFVVIRIMYPPNEVRKLITAQLSKSLNNRHVIIKSAHLNPIKGIELNVVNIYELPRQNAEYDSAKLLSIDNVQLKYKLSSILSRKLKIKNIIIDHPQVRLAIDSLNKTNIDDLLISAEKAQSDSLSAVEAADTTITPFSLPLAFELDQFIFKNFNAALLVETQNTKVEAQISDFSIMLDDLFFPRGSLQNLKNNVRAKAKLISPQSEWKFLITSDNFINPREITAQFDMDINIVVQGFSKIETTALVGFQNITFKELQKITKIPATQFINLAFDLKANGDQGEIKVERFTVQAIDQSVLSLRGEVRDLFNKPYVSLVVDKSNVQLSKIADVMKSILLSFSSELVADFDLGGTLSLKDSKFEGYPTSAEVTEGMKFETIISLNSLNFDYANPKINLENLSLNLVANGNINISGLQQGDVKGKLTFDQLNMEMTDSLNINAAQFETDLLAELSPEYFPTAIRIKTTLQDIMGAFLELDVDFLSKDKLEKYSAQVNCSIENFDLARLPQLAASGFVNGKIAINSSSLAEIQTNVDVSSDTMKLTSETDVLLISPMQLSSEMNIGTDTSFQNFDIKNINGRLNDFLFINGNAGLKKLGEDGFFVVLDTVLLMISPTFQFLPESVTEGLENLSISGRAVMSAIARGKILPTMDPEILIESTINLNIDIDYPVIPISIKNLQSHIQIFSDAKSASACVVMNIDTVFLSDIRSVPFKHTVFHLSGNLPDFEHIFIDSALLKIPDINSKIALTGEVENLSLNPLAKLNLVYLFSAMDSTLIVDEIYCNGKLFTNIDVNFKEPLVQVNGDIRFDNFYAFITDQMVLEKVQGEMAFFQKIDIEKLVLVNENSNRTFLADVQGLNYDLLYPFYLDELFSLSIDKIKVSNYELSDFLMDVKIGNGRIEIPRFILSLYEGNMKGKLYADVGNGDLSKANYYIKTNVSRLNSAKLSPVGAGSAEASELNMNMELNGIGLDPSQQIDFGGYMYITKIGSKFADNVLKSLDPKGTDKSIQDTKRLLKWGYKPKLISFEIKHGNMYPSIHLIKGNFFTKLIPLNLSGGRIELARIPIRFFLDAQLTQAN